MAGKAVRVAVTVAFVAGGYVGMAAGKRGVTGQNSGF